MSKPLRLAMLATGEFAFPTFRALVESASHEVVGLVTQPDRTGRGHHRHVNALKEFATEHRVDVFQPANINEPDSVNFLNAWTPDLFVVAAYGQILKPQVINIPTHGAINLHASILPKYRGAAPIQYAIWNGETETGVSIFQIEPKLDAGPVLGIERTPITPDETAGELHDRLAEVSVPITLRVIDDITNDDLHPVPQPQDGVTKAPRIRKEQGLIDWTNSVHEIQCHIRALTPWPSAFTFFHQQAVDAPLRVTIHSVQPVSEHGENSHSASSNPGQPGEVVSATATQLVIQTGGGLASIETLQPAGKRAMNAADFMRGRTVQPGDVFGPESLQIS